MQSASTAKPLFHRDFSLMVIGQIISLFGNAILRFALSLHVLDMTGSAAVFGGILAISAVPTVLLTPLGGVLADRVPRQRIMYVLDFLTTALLVVFGLTGFASGSIALLAAVMVLLSAIQAFYHPSVQAAIPALTAPERLMQANGVTAQVQSLAGLLGPILGGFLYGFFGAAPILWVSAGCFFCSAVLELFLRIPFTPQTRTADAMGQIGRDLKEALTFLTREKPALFRMLLVAAALNLFLAALFIVGIPYLIKQYLGLSAQLYGFAEACLGLGAILGALLAGVLGAKISIRNSAPLLVISALSLTPLVPALLLGAPPMAIYGLTITCILVGMAASSLFSIMAITFLQQHTPSHMLGKTSAFTSALCMCAMPLGQALYGGLLQVAGSHLWAVFLFSAAATLVVVLLARGTIRNLTAVKCK